jgi:hypothetical protein
MGAAVQASTQKKSSRFDGTAPSDNGAAAGHRTDHRQPILWTPTPADPNNFQHSRPNRGRPNIRPQQKMRPTGRATKGTANKKPTHLLGREAAADGAGLLLAQVRGQVLAELVLAQTILLRLVVHRQHAGDALPHKADLGKLGRGAAGDLGNTELHREGKPCMCPHTTKSAGQHTLHCVKAAPSCGNNPLPGHTMPTLHTESRSLCAKEPTHKRGTTQIHPTPNACLGQLILQLLEGLEQDGLVLSPQLVRLDLGHLCGRGVAGV